MQRRIALALSLAFTTIVTFSIVVVGVQAGLFGGGHKSAKANQVSADAAAPGDAAYPAAAAAAAEQDPLVVTDYMYIDQTAVPVGVRGGRVPSPRPLAPVPQGVTGDSNPNARTSAGAQPSKEDPRQPSPSPAAAPTMSAEPTSPPPAQAPPPTATQPPAPTSTSKPAATATTQPSPAPVSGQPPEIEFVGTVTAINGDLVTFSHGGSSTIVKATSYLSLLPQGAQAHVHAILSGGVYVATEIEAGN